MSEPQPVWHADPTAPGMLGHYPINSIITGDCLDVLPDIPAGSIDITITSPPYNVGLAYDGFSDNMPDDDFMEFTAQWLRQVYRVTANSGRLYACISQPMLFWFRDLAELAGWTFGQVLTWCKPNMAVSKSRMAEWLIMTEHILTFRKGKRTTMQNGDYADNTYDWFIDATPQTNYNGGRQHPAQWPVSLPLRILSRTPGSMVLDPFCGSGSALVAAKMLQRQWLGIELVPSVAERARQRLATTQPPLPLPPEPEQVPLCLTGC